MRIRIFIALMVAAVMLPLIFALAFAVNKIWQEEQAAAFASLQKTVEATSLIVDRDIQSSMAALHAIGNSEHLHGVGSECRPKAELQSYFSSVPHK